MVSQSLTTQWIVTPAEAQALISQNASILDTRNQISWLLGHISGAIHVSWQHFSQPYKPDKGKLLKEDNILQEKLRQMGICNNKPVIVIGNPGHDFGEAGRIVWMLRTLGHTQAALVDCGYCSLIKLGVSVTRRYNKITSGNFIVDRNAVWNVEKEEVKANLGQENFMIIDTREAREFSGATPYGESRGGHVPGAIHFYFKDLLDKEGMLICRSQIIARLKGLGMQQDTEVITYCTGGIRSAFFVVVLATLGFTNVRNYAGSMWEWAAQSADEYPLVKVG